MMVLSLQSSLSPLIEADHSELGMNLAYLSLVRASKTSWVLSGSSSIILPGDPP